MFVNKDEQDVNGNYCLLKTAFPVATIAAVSIKSIITAMILSAAEN